MCVLAIDHLSLLRAASPQPQVVEMNCVRQCDRCCLWSVGLSAVVTDEQGGDVNEGCLTRVTVAQAASGVRRYEKVR